VRVVQTVLAGVTLVDPVPWEDSWFVNNPLFDIRQRAHSGKNHPLICPTGEGVPENAKLGD
jgi:hypothetical protein